MEPPAEPVLSTEERARFREGIDLFNAGHFWHAHEAWEDVWRGQAGTYDAFFKGLIQAAAAFHQLGQGRFRGMHVHFERSLGKLKPFAPTFLGIDLERFLRDLERSSREAQKLSPDTMQAFPRETIPQIVPAPPRE